MQVKRSYKLCMRSFVAIVRVDNVPSLDARTVPSISSPGVVDMTVSLSTSSDWPLVGPFP
jgi:hypothetical protein